MSETTYPDQYLRVYNRRDGTTSIMPIADDEPLDIRPMIVKWLKGVLGQDSDPKVDMHRPGYCTCEYDAAIITDGRPPDTCIVWKSVEFNWTE